MPTQNLAAVTSLLPQVLVSQYVANTETTQFTGAANSGNKISSATLANTSGSAVTVSVSVVKSGGTAGASNRVIPGYSIAPGDSVVLTWLVDVLLGPGDFISAIASAASAVALVITGAVNS